MTGKAYYLTTLGDWQRHAARFANSHFIVLGPANASKEAASGLSAAENPAIRAEETRILVMIEADEGVHLALEDDSAYEPLPHPLAQKPVSPIVQAALATHGVVPGMTTFEATEAIARIHPLLRHRVF
ncbi:MAG TPA: hypothetical protein VHX49_11540 [Candidatus Acidoferrales bacterium]|nr:hypothetical protein [Candidatus Acidoferrales bacterium]